ncbi:cytochrome P450 [Athelia psychrophila]|uniref:Cytochrome P450 n=1 Tax=Athelia psychrophila TaxID=1759441 RepID=A0A167X3E2_9AGAM|nr:cytochrome P450 [Fibularhizoctonia sp. CBS 109695]
MPGAGWKRRAMAWRKHTEAAFAAPFKTMKDAMANGTAKPCFCVRTLQNAEANGELESEERHIQAASGNMFSVLETFMLAMLLHPEVQQLAQAELDRVLGSGRLPTFADQESLPYLSAVMTECLRWGAIVPLALPHVLTENDEYHGYFLPKGTIVIASSFHVLHDEEVYPEPSAFKPERFLKDGEIDPSARNPVMVASFGYGRRVCPGRSLAEQFTWLMAACILATFDISKAVDRDGNVIEPSGRYIMGLARRHEAFECQIKPRSSEVRDFIKNSVASEQ